MKRKFTTVLFCSMTLVLAAAGAFAAAPAFDSAGDCAYDTSGGGWVSGDNGGFGFSPWILPGTSFGTFFIFTGSAVINGDGLDDGLNYGAPPRAAGDGDINVPSADGPKSWGLLADPTSVPSLAEAIRPFAGPPLLAGETFSIDFDNGSNAPGAAVGFA
jgi:hypothetical protein